MRLIRSYHGLENLALFHGVEIIILTEGGDGEGATVAGTADEFFWHLLAEKFLSLKVRVQSVGGSSVLEELYELKPSNRHWQNVVFARDSDHNQDTSRPDFLQTWGYSWESDVWQKEVFCEALRCTAYLQTLSEEFEEKIESYFEELNKAAQFVAADRTEIANGNVGVFDRKNPLRHIDKSSMTWRLESFPATTDRSSTDSARWIHGHTREAFLLSAFAKLVKQLKLGNLSTVAIRTLVLTQFKQMLERIPEVFEHHLHQFQRLSEILAQGPPTESCERIQDSNTSETTYSSQTSG